MKIILISLILVVILGVEKSFSDEFQIDQECLNNEFAESLECRDKFTSQSVNVFSVVDSSIGIIKDPKTGLTVVDLGTFYGIAGNGTVPDEIRIFRDSHLWKTLYKETGIAPSTSHSEWQIPQTVFYNELPGKYTISLITNNTETLSYEFMVKQIIEAEENNGKIINSIIPPLKQFKSGIAVDEIQCKEDFVLILKYNDSPACVTYQTGKELLKRGWAMSSP